MSNGNGTGDVQYEQAVQYAQDAKTKAETAVSDVTLRQARSMADQLAAALNDDSAGIGLASELADEIGQVLAHAKAMQDKAQALEDHIIKAHGGTHDAAQAAGVMAQTGFHGH
jgi:hypothetical protein